VENEGAIPDSPRPRVRPLFSQCSRVIGPVADPLEVEALIAQEQAWTEVVEQAGIAVVVQVSTEAEASGEPVAGVMAATPAVVEALAEAQA
jgi:hypothetical protein